VEEDEEEEDEEYSSGIARGGREGAKRSEQKRERDKENSYTRAVGGEGLLKARRKCRRWVVGKRRVGGVTGWLAAGLVDEEGVALVREELVGVGFLVWRGEGDRDDRAILEEEFVESIIVVVVLFKAIQPCADDLTNREFGQAGCRFVQ
jgi:hypothetical protein